MTNQEAIEVLKLNNPFMAGKDKETFSKAIDKGIKALENQKTGHWIRLIEDYPECDLEFKGCSVCRTHYPHLVVKHFKYCPNCGAKMKGE